MHPARRQWRVRDKTRLLLAVMEELADEASISFEGNLHGFGLLNLPGAIGEETTVLKRNTRWPLLDFVVVPLDRSVCKRIISAIGGAVPRRIIHIQIEKAGVLEFGAYDNFHPECIFFGRAVTRQFLESLISQNVLNSD